MASDHRGFDLKNQIKQFLATADFKAFDDTFVEVLDAGAEKLDQNDDFVDYAKKAVELARAADRDSSALGLAREAGLYGAFLPRSAFHANRDGYERRLVEILRASEAEAVALAGFDREPGPVLTEAFPGRVYGRGLGPVELVAELEKRLRRDVLTLVSPAE